MCMEVRNLEAKKAEIYEYLYNNILDSGIIMLEAENVKLARKAEHIINFITKVEVLMEPEEIKNDIKLLTVYIEECAELERIKEQINYNEWKIEEIKHRFKIEE